jgi:alcohol dehydrogenase class IV
MKDFDFHLPTKIRFGRGRVGELGSLVPAGSGRVFVVTDDTVATKTPALDAVLRALQDREVRTSARVEENPSLATVEACGREARDFGAHLIVGLGGGSPMDAAKGVALLAANPGPLARYVGGDPLENDPLPIIAVPTTSGTGSEVTPYAVFTDPAAGNKVGYGHPGIFPSVALIDPELTYSMPPPVVINTGLDVLSHAVEAYLSTLSFPLNDALALHAVEVTLSRLGRAAMKDREAMDDMAAAAAVAGAAIAHASTILPHIMGYPLTVHHGVPHGRASAVMMVHVLEALRSEAASPDKVKTVDALFAPHGGAAGFLNGLGVSTRLSDYGVCEDELALYVRKTIVKSDVKITPGRVTAEGLERIYRSAL